MPIRPLPRTPWAWGAVLFALLAARPAAAQVAKGGAKAAPPPGPRPVALLVPLEDYNKAPLKYPVESATRLAARLSENGYAVTLLADSKANADRATRRLKEEKAEGVTVEVVSSKAEEVDKQVWQWFSGKLGEYKTPAPLGLLVLSGHGEMRKGEQYLLTKADAPGQGGVDVGAIQARAAEKRLPLVMLVDACTTDPTAGGPPQPGAKGWGTGFDFGKGSLEKGGRHAVTTVYARQPGKVAPDEKDLVGCFADVLEIDPDTQRFKAHQFAFDEHAFLADRANPNELTLKGWVHAATTRYQWRHDCEPHALQRGQVDLLTTVVATRPAGKGAKAALPGPAAVSVLGEWRVTNTTFQEEWRGGWVRFTRGPNDSAEYGYFVGDLPVEVDTDGKTLVLEVYSEGVTQFQVHAKNQADKSAVYFTVAAPTTVYTVTDRTPTTLLIPLKKGTGGQKLTSIGVATAKDEYDRQWPKGASLTVTGVRVVDTAGLPEALRNKGGTHLPAPPNLLARWWHNDAPPDKLPHLAAAGGWADKAKTVPYLELSRPSGGDKAGWRGGRVEPPVLVPGGAEVAVEVSVNPAEKGLGRAAEVVLYAGEKVVARLPLAPAEVKKTKTVTATVAATTSVDYMTVTTDGSGLRLGRVGVQPTPAK